MPLLYNTCGWSLAGTKTFRRASQTLLGIWGTNLQNSTDEIMRIYTAPPGYKFVSVDQSGAEALIVAFLCRHGNFRDLFLNNIKPHVFVAMHLFKDVWQEEFKYDMEPFCTSTVNTLKNVPKWTELNKLIRSSDYWESKRRFYFIAKMVCHASNYGITSGMLLLHILQKSGGTIALSGYESEFFLNLYHGLFPEIREWHMETERIVAETRELRNLQGFPIRFNKQFTPKYLKDIIAWVPQSTVGAITQTAVTEFYHQAKDTWQCINDKHDSFMSLVPEGDSLECAKLMKSLIEQELVSPRGEHFKMKSEASIGSNWGHWAEDNPEGMKAVEI